MYYNTNLFKFAQKSAFNLLTAPGIIKNFTLSGNIRANNLNKDSKVAKLEGLTGSGILANKLLFVDSENNVVSSFDVRSQSVNKIRAARRVYSKNRERVSAVAYGYIDAKHTMFVATRNNLSFIWDRINDFVFVRSYRRNGSGQWEDHNRQYAITFNREVSPVQVSLRVLNDGTLLCGVWRTNELHVCRPQHTICTIIKLADTHFGFDVQQLVGKQVHLAAAFANGSVVLFSLQIHELTQHINELTREPLAGARNPIFSSDILLVGVAPSGNEIQEAKFFETTEDGQRTELRLIAGYTLEHTHIYSWCFVNRQLYAWDSRISALLSYEFSYSANAN